MVIRGIHLLQKVSLIRTGLVTLILGASLQIAPTVYADTWTSVKVETAAEPKPGTTGLVTTAVKELAATKINLSVSDADIRKVVIEVINITRARVRIETRKLETIKVSLTVENMEVGKILKAVAALAGGDLFILPDRILIAPVKELTAAELNSVTKQAQMAANAVSNPAYYRTLQHVALAETLVESLKQQKIQQIPVAKLSQHDRLMLERLSQAQAEDTKTQAIMLSGDTLLKVVPAPGGGFNMSVTSQSQQRAQHWLNVTAVQNSK